MHAILPPSRRRAHHRQLRTAALAAAAVLCCASAAIAETGGAAPDTAVSFAAAPVTSPAVAPPAVPATPEPAPPPLAPATAPPRPADLGDVNEWLDYKSKSPVALLPDEARLFYRRGLMARESGSREEAIQLVRAATQLDPTFPLPYLTLGSWFLVAEPGQGLAHFASLLEVARQSFPFQLALQANAIYFVLQSVLLALVITGVLLVVARGHELRHRWQEYLGRFLPRSHAVVWSWIFLVGPYLLGLGPALPTVVFLGMLWPMLKWNERSVLVLLVATLGTMPMALAELDRLGSPLREDRPPLFGVLQLQNAPHSPELARRLEGFTREHPDHAFLWFARAWNARRTGDLADAETSYRRALELWPEDDRTLNNLGNVITLQGRADEALAIYERASNTNPFNAAPHYNRARILTDRYDFRSAAEAMSRASALNFDLLQPYHSQLGGGKEALPPVDQWIAPRRFWGALASYDGAQGAQLALPPAWRSRIECSGWGYSGATLALAVASIVFGAVAHRRLPLRHCGNCGRIVCRRCAQRRREIALCPGCAAVAARAESGDFAPLLLADHQRRLQRRERLWQTAFATLVPGLGWILHRQAFVALTLISACVGVASLAFGLAGPFAYLPRIHYPEAPISPAMVALPWAAIYLVSIGGYFVSAHAERVRHEAQIQSARRARVRRSMAQAA
jgi:tetratricopeptide (TPR) repeat protein